MTHQTPGTEYPVQKPRLALMGEFSAGKSTLSNLLLGADPLPVQVTATRLPPVWISYGENAATREDFDGNSFPVDLGKLDAVKLSQTRLIRLSQKSELLQLCDLIDMPGISDPNMEADVWREIIGEADTVIWCTHATQAWRQSEAAVWDSLPDHMREKSLLLLTRFDKILSSRDRERVLSRVRRETRGLFSDLFPISLTQALVAGDDHEAWKDSGAEDFVNRLIDLLMHPDNASGATYDGTIAPPPEEPAPTVAPPPSTVRIMPTRVRAKPGGQRRTQGGQSGNLVALCQPPLGGVPGNVPGNA